MAHVLATRNKVARTSLAPHMITRSHKIADMKEVHARVVAGWLEVAMLAPREAHHVARARAWRGAWHVAVYIRYRQSSTSRSFQLLNNQGFSR